MTRSRALTLYRSILRAHKRFLPTQMQDLGNKYVRNEFKLHKNAQQPQQIALFFTEWDKYLDQITMTARSREALDMSGIANDKQQQNQNVVVQWGRDLPHDVQLTDEQKQRLEKLRSETGK